MKKMTELIAIRHGETEWNKLGKQQGHFDSPLTRTGVRQAQLVAKAIGRKDVDVVYSSDLGRALATAGIIAKKLHVKVHAEPGLRERGLGILQGMTLAGFKEKFPREYRKLRSNDPDYIIPRGESSLQSSTRLVSCLRRIVRKNKNKRVLVVMHGGNLSSLFRYVLGIPLTQKRYFAIVNAGINRFVIDNDVWQLKSWGETSHLKNIKALDDF
jgi:probable phosphoglycerate mutase